MKALIINADDFGRSDAVNAAIRRCVESGTVRSVTVLANMPAAAAVADLQRLGCSIGLHVNLTEGMPTLPAAAVGSLVGRDGRFHPFAKLARRATTGLVRMPEIEAEVESQLSLLAAWVGKISHFDSHEHVHLLPPVLRAIVRVGERHSVRCVRTLWRCFVCHHPADARTSRLPIRHVAASPQSMLGLLLKRHQARQLRRHVFATPDYFLTPFPVVPSAPVERAIDAWKRVLDRMPDGTAETNCHPGHSVGDEGLFAHPAFRRATADAGVTLADYSTIERSRE